MSSYLPGQRSDEGVDTDILSGARHVDTAAPNVSTPGELPRVSLVGYAIREMGPDALDAALDESDRLGITLAEFIEKRRREIRAQLVMDAAPKALRELRRVQG